MSGRVRTCPRANPHRPRPSRPSRPRAVCRGLALALVLAWSLPEETHSGGAGTDQIHPILRTQRWRMGHPSRSANARARAAQAMRLAQAKAKAGRAARPPPSNKDPVRTPAREGPVDRYGHVWYQPFFRPAGGWKVPLTPGQHPAGHPSYLTKECKTHVDPNFPRYQGLRSQRLQQSAKVQPAWTEGHLNKKDMGYINRVLASAQRWPWCPYLTKECVEPGKTYTTHQSYKRKEDVVENTTLSQEEYDSLPSLPPGSLGSCAFVALADQLKYGAMKYGKIIDAHDTVIRPGHPPVAGYERYVGSRTDAVVYRHSTMSTTRLPKDYRGVRYTLGYRIPDHNATALDRWTLQRHWNKAVGYDQIEFWPTLYGAVAGVITSKNNAPRLASTGGIMVLELALSGLCSRLDVYGMSNHHGVHYFCKFEQHRNSPEGSRHYIGATPCTTAKRGHSLGLETWLFNYMMKNFPEFNMCIYM